MRKNSIKNTRINGEVQRELSNIIRSKLAKTVNLRNTPEIRFVLDQSIEYGVKMSKMIDEVTKDIKSEDDAEE